ncbi:hypothetical protein JOY44_21520 [Phormidium sp. CLA17]|uniref:hypothetical protein n=1 Tax=Leptolyngbya sp. Cla-17 TaxID=2803751 RepID=UPI0014908B29|nr:hypothetical protein [Leptolyngbya sp. Cla-17]MBM0744162.1 hypothetical protein [Leptolyngbya sp. Cla-17]
MSNELKPQPKYVEKRPRYFDGQYLSVDDFVNEQEYHIDRQRRISQFLHVSGILEGLQVTIENTSLTITPGAAINNEGRQILIAQKIEIDLSKRDLAKSTTYNLSIAWNEIGSDPQVAEGSPENTRTYEEPTIAISEEISPSSVLLAVLKRQGTTNFFDADLTSCQYSGLKLPAEDGNGVTLRSQNGASDLAVLSGNLSITQNLEINGNVGIGGASSTEKLKVEGNTAIAGNLSVTGTSTLNGNTAITGTLNITSTNGVRFAVPSGFMASGSLTIGSTNQNYGGGQRWNASTAGLLLETHDDTEIAVHDSDTRLASFMHYEGAKNRFTIGRAMNGNGETSAVAIAGNLSITGTSKLAGNVGIGADPGIEKLRVTGSAAIAGTLSVTGVSFGSSMSQMIDLWNSAYGIGIQGGTQYFRTDANFAWYKGGSHDDTALKAGISGTVQMVIKDCNVGISTNAPESKLHIDNGRVDITASDAKGGGGNRFNGLLSHTEGTHKRSQLVVSSGYSDLVIASSQANDNHGSNLTFVTSNPTDASKYRKWVINQGNWGTRKQFLEFGYSDKETRANPHDNINDTDTVLTLEGVEKKVGIGTRTPTETLDVKGNIKATDATLTGNLSITGTSTLTGKVGIGGASGTETLKVTGDAAIAGALDVNGAAMLGYESNITDFGSPLKSGFYQNDGNKKITGNVPDISSDWTHLITARHSNTGNNHQLQIAANYTSNDRLFFRKIAVGTSVTSNPTWNEVATRTTNIFNGDQTIVGTLSADGLKIKRSGSADGDWGISTEGALQVAQATITGTITYPDLILGPDLRIRWIEARSNRLTDTMTFKEAYGNDHMARRVGGGRNYVIPLSDGYYEVSLSVTPPSSRRPSGGAAAANYVPRERLVGRVEAIDLFNRLTGKWSDAKGDPLLSTSFDRSDPSGIDRVS